MKAIVILTAGALVAGPAIAGDAAAVKADRDKVVCKVETTVGTLIPGPRRCHTRAEWDEHARAGQAIARHLVQDNTGQPIVN